MSSWDCEGLQIVQKSTQAYSEASSPRGTGGQVTHCSINQKHAEADKSESNPDTHSLTRLPWATMRK